MKQKFAIVWAVGIAAFVGTLITTDYLRPGQEVAWSGEVLSLMTYGRLEIRLNEPAHGFETFIAEPDDVIWDGALRWSPTTQEFEHGDRVIVRGVLVGPIEASEPPWVAIEEIERLTR